MISDRRRGFLGAYDVRYAIRHVAQVARVDFAPVDGDYDTAELRDVLRAMDRDEVTVEAFLVEVDAARGANSGLDSAIDMLKSELANRKGLELRARAIVEQMAVVLQAALLVRHAPASVSDAFCATRLGSRWLGAYGVLPEGVDLDGIIARALPGD